MKTMEETIREALEREDPFDAQARMRIYASARKALERNIARQGDRDSEVAERGRQRLEEVIAHIEADFAVPPAESGEPVPADRELEFDGSQNDDVPGASRLDIAPGRQEPAGQPAPAIDTPAVSARKRQPQQGDDVSRSQADRPARPAARSRWRKTLIIVILIALVLVLVAGYLALFGPSLPQTGTLQSRVPFSDSISRAPSRLNENGANWITVFTPGDLSQLVIGSAASVEQIGEIGKEVLRITSGSGDTSGEVQLPVPPGILRQLTGRKVIMSLIVRGTQDSGTQFSVRCDLLVQGACGRKRFEVTGQTTEILFDVARGNGHQSTNGTGRIMINSDITGAGQALDVIAIRIQPDG